MPAMDGSLSDCRYKLRAADPSECLAWQRAIAGTLEQYARFGAWSDRDAGSKARFFEELQNASVVSGASAKPLAAKFAPKFRCVFMQQMKILQQKVKTLPLKSYDFGATSVLRNAVVRRSFAAQVCIKTMKFVLK